MKRIHISIVIILVFLVLIGCGSRKPAAIYQTIHDTITKEKVVSYRDTVFVTEKVNTSISTPCDSITEIPKKKKEKNATQSIYKDKKGNIVAECECDTIALKAQIKSEFQKEYQKTKVENSTIEKVKYIPLWVKILACVGGIFLVLLIISIIKIFKK